MHLVAAAWLMSTLTASAALIAMVQTAQAFPTFALALPAGALADILDRRRWVIATQGWQVVAAGTLAVLTLADATTPALLLVLTLLLGTGAALGLPVLGAILPEIVPPREVPAAVSLNSVS